MWQIRVDHYHHQQGCTANTPCALLVEIDAQLSELKGMIMSTQEQLASDILAVADKVTKVGAETRTLLAKIGDLQAALNNAGAVSPEVTEAMAVLQTQVDVVDLLVPDAPAPAPVDEPAAT
jgi:hypothetical protein